MRLLITLKSKWYGYFDHFCFEIVLYNARRSFLSIIDVQPPWEKSTRLPSLRKYLHPTRTHAPPPICHYIRQQPKRDSFFDSTSDEGSMGTTIGRIRTIFHLDTVIRSFWLADLLKIFRLVVSSTIRPFVRGWRSWQRTAALPVRLRVTRGPTEGVNCARTSKPVTTPAGTLSSIVGESVVRSKRFKSLRTCHGMNKSLWIFWLDER